MGTQREDEKAHLKGMNAMATKKVQTDFGDQAGSISSMHYDFCS